MKIFNPDDISCQKTNSLLKDLKQQFNCTEYVSKAEKKNRKIHGHLPKSVKLTISQYRTMGTTKLHWTEKHGARKNKITNLYVLPIRLQKGPQ